MLRVTCYITLTQTCSNTRSSRGSWMCRKTSKRTVDNNGRGRSNREIFDTFMAQGGTELAPMSTTRELWVALQYAQRTAGRISTLLWLRTDGFMDRGVDLEWLSAFPHEKEYVYSPLSYLKPKRSKPIVLKMNGGVYQIVELKITMG